MKNNINITGYVRGYKRTACGLIVPFEGPNLVVNAGKALIASRLKNAVANPVSHIAIGSNNTLATEEDTALLGTEHERVSATITVTANVFLLEATFGSGVTGDVTVGEFGIFNAASVGTLLARFTCNPLTLENTSELVVSWSLQFGD